MDEDKDKEVLERVEQSGKFRKGHHFTAMQPLKPGKNTIYAFLGFKDIQNQR